MGLQKSFAVVITLFLLNPSRACTTTKCIDNFLASQDRAYLITYHQRLEAFYEKASLKVMAYHYLNAFYIHQMHFLHYVVYLTSILSSVFKSINLLNIVNGGFTLWTQWSTCTRTCGGGTTTRQRFCTNPAPANGGLTCAQQQATIGNAVETISCSTNGCPGRFYFDRPNMLFHNLCVENRNLTQAPNV